MFDLRDIFLVVAAGRVTAFLPRTSMTKLKWSSGSLLIENPPQFLLDRLGYEHKELQMDGRGGRASVKVWTKLWTQVTPDTVVCFQGLLDRVRHLLGAHPHVLEDAREPMPPTQLQLADGFRHFQYEVFLKALRAGRSGIIKIPTRTGKSYLIRNFMQIWPKLTTVVTAPGIDLLQQHLAFLTEQFPDRKVRGIFSGAKRKGFSEDITVASMDSLEKLPTDDVRLLLIDEPHAAAAPTRINLLAKFNRARIYGLGATTTGRFDNADVLIEGLIGPVLVQKTFPEAVAAGAVCPITVYLLKVPFTPRAARTRDLAYRYTMYENELFNQTIKSMLDQVVPLDWQTLVFIDERKQGQLLNLLVTDGVVAIASEMSAAQRKSNFAGMADGSILRGIATMIYSTGVTFPDLRVIINAAGGGGNISSTQKPGRLAQIRPGKLCGYVIDFILDPQGSHDAQVQQVVRDCWARHKAYVANGYDVRVVDYPGQIVLR